MRKSSIEAHESIKPHKDSHYKIIKNAMIDIGKPATSRNISMYCELDYHEVARRLSEMEVKDVVRVCGRAYNEPKRPLLWDVIS